MKNRKNAQIEAAASKRWKTVVSKQIVVVATFETPFKSGRLRRFIRFVNLFFWIIYGRLINLEIWFLH